MTSLPYEITVRGRLGDALVSAFEPLALVPTAHDTVLRGQLDQAALHGLLERVESLGLELVAVRRLSS